VVAIMLLGVLAMAARVAVDSDTWWHLRAGAWMVTHGHVLDRDEFTSTFAGQAWRYPAWLSQTAFYMVFSRFGYGGLNTLTALCVVAAFALVYAASTGRVYVRALAVLLGAAASSVFWAARPHMASFVLGAAFLLILELYRRRGRNYLWLLPVLMALWANLHPGFAIGFIFIGLVGLGEIGRALLGQQSWRAVGWLAAAGLACLLAILITPYGPDLMLFPFQTVAISTLRDRIQEWQSPNFHLREAQVFIALWLLTLAAVGFSRQPLDVTDFVLLAGTFYLALLAGRNLALFALVAPPILSRHASAALAALRERDWPVLARWRRPPAPPVRHAALFNWLILGLVAVATLLKVVVVSDPALNAQLATRGLPVAAVDYLAEQDLPGPLYNPYEWGGYLAWRLYPAYPIFVDGRTDLYPEPFLQDYLRLSAGAPDWETLLARYHIRLVLVPAGSALAELVTAQPGWIERYADSTAVVLSHP
jgi:hypothetical protein